MSNSNLHTCEKSAPGWQRNGVCQQCQKDKEAQRFFATIPTLPENPFSYTTDPGFPHTEATSTASLSMTCSKCGLPITFAEADSNAPPAQHAICPKPPQPQIAKLPTPITDSMAFDVTDEGNIRLSPSGLYVDADEARKLELERNDADYMGNLLAIIHRDAGHYRLTHGNKKATDDAIEIVAGIKRELDEAKENLKAVSNELHTLASGQLTIATERDSFRAKAEAFDWLSNNFYYSAIQECKDPKYKSWVFHIPSEDGYTDLLSAIQKAQQKDEVE